MLNEIATGVYYEDGYVGGDIGLIRTGLGAILIDSPPLPHQGRDWQARLAELAPEGSYALINTDFHLERMLGNAVFGSLRTFGHEAAAKPISKYSVNNLEQFAGHHRDLSPEVAAEIAQTVLTVPQISVEDRMTIYAPEIEVQVLFLEGHTPGSLGVYLPQECIFFAGDTITHDEPPALVSANSLAWLDTLARIEAMEIETIVPASGPPCGKEAIAPMRDYIIDMRAQTKALFDGGASRRECVEKVDLPPYYEIPKGQETRYKRRRRESIERVYTEIRLAQRRRRS